MYDRDEPQTVMVEGHTRYRTEIVAEVQDLGA